MLTICGWGGPDPRPSALAFPPLRGEDEVPLHKSSGRLAARDGTFKKVLVLGRGTSRCCSFQPEAGQGGGRRGKLGERRGGLASGVWGRVSSGRPGATVERAELPLQSEGTPAARGDPASVPTIGGAPHLD